MYKLSVLTVITKTKKFTVLANQRALYVSRNAEKNLQNNSENNTVRNFILLADDFFFKILFWFNRNFCLTNSTETDLAIMIQITSN